MRPIKRLGHTSGCVLRATVLASSVLVTLLPRCLGQVGSVDVDVGTVMVTLPPAIAVLWEKDVSELHAFAGAERVAVASSCTIHTTRGAEIDRLLLFGGRHCRWATRATDGTFAWESTGYVLAGRLPAELPGAWDSLARPLRVWIDMLGPVDGQDFPGRSILYPRICSYFSDRDSFVFGVPGPGRWSAIVNFSGGPEELLASLEAVPDSSAETPFSIASVEPFDCRVRFELPMTPASGNVSCLSRRGWSGDDRCTLDSNGERHSIELRLQVANSTGITWVWQPGWEVQPVDGRAFTSAQGVIVRLVRPEHVLRVRVVDTSRSAISPATVMLRDEQGEEVPAAWSEDGDASQARLFWWGKTGPQGVVHAHGIPLDGELSIRASAKGFEAHVESLPRDRAFGSGAELVLQLPRVSAASSPGR